MYYALFVLFIYNLVCFALSSYLADFACKSNSIDTIRFMKLKKIDNVTEYVHMHFYNLTKDIITHMVNG